MSKILSAAPCCTACGSECIVKNGYNACGSAQFACRACGAHRVLAPKRQPVSPQRQKEVLCAVATERLSLRAAERVFGVARQTIAKRLEKKPKLCRR